MTYFQSKKTIISFFVLFLSLVSCNKKQNETQSYSFYYWRTSLVLDDEEKKALQKSTGKFLYTRFFDIDVVNGKIIPVGILKTNNENTQNIQKKIVPVIFVTNETWIGADEAKLKFIAEKTHQLIEDIAGKNHLSIENEIQIDSDWTTKTRENYFRFLEILKQISNSKITCTIRLHQIKDKNKTGIPPVEKGYLMCYATSSPLEDQKENSILDVLTLKKYLSNLDEYPLQLDIALPIYSWGIVTNHLGKKKLINALNEKILDQNDMFSKISEGIYRVERDDFFEGIYLSKGFVIKVEEIDPTSIDQTLAFIRGKLKKYDIIYYHLDSKFLNNYNFESK